MISIVIPVFNVAKFLPYCIESILKQTYQDFELILVDDGSNDGSGDICDTYALQDRRIIVEHCCNKGVAIARNTGTLKASGEYICYIDADDWIAEDYLSVLYECAQKNNLDIVQVGFYYAYDSFLMTEKVLQEIESYDTFEAMRFLLQQRKIKNFPWGKLIRTGIAKRHLFPDIKNYEDSYWFYRILNEVKLYVIINKPLYFYRQRTNSLTSKLNTSALLLLKGAEERIEFMRNNYKHLIPLAFKEYFKLLISLYCAAIESDKSVKQDFYLYKNQALSKYASDLKLLCRSNPYLFFKIQLLIHCNWGLLFIIKLESVLSRFRKSNFKYINKNEIS